MDDCKQSAKKTADSAWGREGIHLRLTASRKAALRALMSGVEATPTEAIDRAIQIASAGRAGFSSDEDDSLGAISDAIERLAHEQWINHKEAMMSAEATRGAMESLASLISRVAGEDFEDGSISSPSEPLDIPAWLDSEARRMGVAMSASVIASAMWRGTSRDGGPFISMSFESRITHVDAKPIPAAHGRDSLVKLELVSADSPLARADLRSHVWLVCQREAGRPWRSAVFAAKPGGGFGPEIDFHQDAQSPRG